MTTSSATDAAIREFFEANNCFGLDRKRPLRSRNRARCPRSATKGTILLAGPERIFRSPDGHGGAIAALKNHGILDVWKAQGIEVVCTFQVDNPLLAVVDPDFIGRLLAKATRRSRPRSCSRPTRTSPSGSWPRSAAGRPSSSTPRSATPRRTPPTTTASSPTGSRRSPCTRSISTFCKPASARRCRCTPPRKEIPQTDAEGTVTRTPGIKYERFLFDLFPQADSVTVVESLREREFAPVKNADGADSPATARAALEAEYRRWYEEAGVAPPAPAEGEEDLPLELSPLDALGPDDLR